MNPLPFLLLAVVVIGIMLAASRERFQPEFLDKTQVQKTVAVEDSSYRQDTNHVNPAPYNMGPIAGVRSPFQVNQFKAYIV
jgi:hypothetical protein